MDTFFFRFVTMHAFDRRTDRQTDRQTENSSLDRVCIPCTAVKMIYSTAEMIQDMSVNSVNSISDDIVRWIVF